MNKGLIAPHNALLDALREESGQSDQEVTRAHWSSLVCKACGVCCHSSLVPVADADFDAFYARLALGIDKETFAQLFLQSGGENRPVQSLETKRFGGCCLFLERKDFFACAIWDNRPDVCRHFFCSPMIAFAACEEGKEQELFDATMCWEKRFDLLLEKVADEVIPSLFMDDQISYLKSREPAGRASYFESHPALFGMPS